MARNELDYFYIDGEYGGDQDWFTDWWMNVGGCAAETACEASLYFLKYFGLPVAPELPDQMSRQDYIAFAGQMKPYLRPRMHGVNRLSLFTDGYGKYLSDLGADGITMDTLDGYAPWEEAFEAVQDQIDSGIPVSVLILRHRAGSMKEYVWHWFTLTGWEDGPRGRRVKAVTYGEWEWLDFWTLWNTGYKERGGLILYRLPEDAVYQPCPRAELEPLPSPDVGPVMKIGSTVL